MAHVDQETFKVLLAKAGIEQYLEPAGNALDHEVEQLMRLRNETS